MDPLAIAECAAPLESQAAPAATAAALAEFAAAGPGAALRRLVLSDPEALLAFLEAEADKVRRQLALRRQVEEERLRDLKLRALAELAAGAAHEINNPLAVISGQAQHLLKSEESLERAKALERIIVQCKRVHTVLTDLMFYSRPPRPQLRSVSLGKLLTEVAAGIAPQALDRRVRIDVEAPAQRLTVSADLEMLEKAIRSLMLNAVEATPTDGQVLVTIRSTAQHTEIVVEDNGPGLTPLECEHLFDPFFSGRAAGRGAGLGLSKAWRVAELHGGSIRFTSNPGEPTRFILMLPQRAPTNGKHPSPPRSSPRATRNNGSAKHRRR